MFVFGVDVQSVHFQPNCHRYEMSQWMKCPVDVPFGSKCSVDVPLVDVPSRHPGKGVCADPVNGGAILGRGEPNPHSRDRERQLAPDKGRGKT